MDGEWHTSSHRVGEVKTHSAGGIFTAADAEPKDRVVTEQELARLMSTFDTDRNGVLSSTERREFDERHPVVVEDWRDR